MTDIHYLDELTLLLSEVFIMMEMFLLGVGMFIFVVLWDRYPKFKAFWLNLWNKLKSKFRG